ncbi:uncharacterized protein GLRG_02811 [Colletotrichum graminicola M1.001]|uniref:Uncharacterized protein n=1 Tax=Colletotrichum graminicola (strain M1.001 / M2 / FGSC 10212) TaxID=645133 RepID=E3Q9X9_COLGM|nr:uncharacterized protein GLRG_02811 [Colletotrichum graminicola M1.001]EFQ27667.1 hypothetical protein GLRG_02811 [Colletotrichum graminicola M1.001]
MRRPARQLEQQVAYDGTRHLQGNGSNKRWEPRQENYSDQCLAGREQAELVWEGYFLDCVVWGIEKCPSRALLASQRIRDCNVVSLLFAGCIDWEIELQMKQYFIPPAIGQDLAATERAFKADSDASQHRYSYDVK